MSFYALAIVGLTLAATFCLCIALIGDMRTKRFWSLSAVSLATFGYFAPDALGTRQINSLGADIQTPGYVYSAAAVALYCAAGCAFVALTIRSATGKSTPLYLSVGLIGLVFTRIAATFFETGGFDVYYVLWLLVVLGLLSSVAEHRNFLLALRWIPRFVTTTSLLAAVVAPGWAMMTVNDSGRSLLGLGRLMGITAHPNSLAQYAVIGLAYELFGPRSKRRRFPWVTSALVCVTLTQSTTALIATGILLLVWLLRSGGNLRTYISCMTLAIAGWLIWIEIGTGDRLLSTDRFQTASGREIIWQYSWDAIQQHPMIGLGSQFLSEDFRAIYLPANQQQAVHAHNQVIQTLGESGFVGAAFLCVVFLGLLIHAVKSISWNGYGLLATWCAVAVLSYTEVLLRSAGPTGVIGMLVLAFLAQSPGSRREDYVPSSIVELDPQRFRAPSGASHAG